MSESILVIIYMRYIIPVNYGIAVKTSVVYTNSQFPSFLAFELNRVIVLRGTGLYSAFL